MSSMSDVLSIEINAPTIRTGKNEFIIDIDNDR